MSAIISELPSVQRTADIKTNADEKGQEGDEKDTQPSFENVLETLGPLGRFQIIQAAFIYLSKLFMAFVFLSFVFQGYTPAHVCNPVNETSLLSEYGLDNITGSYQIVYESCHIKVKVVIANNTHESQGQAQGEQLNTLYTTDCRNGRNFHDAKHTTFLSDWDLVCESSGLAEVSQTFYTVGQMTGAFIGTFIADRFGRKPVFIGSQFCATIAEFCIMGAPNIFVVYALKLLSGISYQSLACCYFVYAMEFITPRHRHAFGVITCLLWTLGLMTVGALAQFLRNESWRYFQACVGVSGLVCLAYPFVIYESPRWLAATGKTEEALRVLEKASKMNGKEFDDVKETFMTYVRFVHPSRFQSLSEIGKGKEEITNTLSDIKGKGKEEIINTLSDMFSEKIDETKQKIKDKIDGLLKIPELVRYKLFQKTTWIACFLYLTNLLTYYGLFMTSSNLAGNRFLNFTLLTLVEIPSNICMYFMMKKMNRRHVLVFCFTLTAASIMASTLIITFAQGKPGSDQVSMVFLIVGKFAITASFNVIFIVAPDVFPTKVIAFCSSVARPATLIAPYLRLLYGVAKWGPGLVFVVMCMVAVLLTNQLPVSKDADQPETLGDSNKKEKKRKRNRIFVIG